MITKKKCSEHYSDLQSLNSKNNNEDVRECPYYSNKDDGMKKSRASIEKDVNETLHTSLTSTGELVRYYVISITKSGNNFNDISPIYVNNCLNKVTRDISIKKLGNSGNLLVECHSNHAADKIKQITSVGSYSVTVEPHRSLNFSIGIFFSSELDHVNDNELLEELENQKVCRIKRIELKNSNKKLFQITFSVPNLPSKIKIGYLSIPIQNFVPRPYRCFNCQRYEYHKNCKLNAICGKCGKPKHDDSCTDIKCYSCRGNHPVWDKTCPIYKREVEIRKTMVDQKISYGEAKRKLLSTQKSFASVTASTNKIEDDLVSRLIKVIEKLENRLSVIEGKISTNILTEKDNLKPSPPETSTIPSNTEKQNLPNLLNAQQKHNSNEEDNLKIEKCVSHEKLNVNVCRNKVEVYDSNNIANTSRNSSPCKFKKQSVVAIVHETNKKSYPLTTKLDTSSNKTNQKSKPNRWK